MKQYLFFDTETASFSGPIMQLAYMTTDEKGNFLKQWEGLLKHEHDYEVDEKAFKIHGITKAKCDIFGLPPVPVLEIIAHEIDLSSLVICHNLAFDWRMLQTEWHRYGLFQNESENKKAQAFCTMSNDSVTKFVIGTKKSVSLMKLHTHLFGEYFDGAHDALVDVRATAKCFFELKRRGIIDV